MEGIKETKEVIIAILKLANILIVPLKDGAQPEDAVAILNGVLNDEEAKAAIVEAAKDIHLVQGEVKDLSLPEALEILIAAQPELMKLIENLKK